MYEQFKARADEAAGGNLSLLAAVAIKELLKKPASEVVQLVAWQRYDRQAATRSAWMRAYWEALGALMGQPDQDPFDNPYSPRRFGNFYAVLLLNRVGHADEEGDPFFPHIGPMPVMLDSPAPAQWSFPRSTTPLAAAEVVAAKLREYGCDNYNIEGR